MSSSAGEAGDAAGAPSDGDRATALRSLRAIVASLGQSARSVESRTGLTNGQLFLLRELAATDAMTVTELSARARARQNTVSTMLVRLVDAGFVRKARTAADGRRAMVSLTPSGRRIVRRAPTPPTTSLLEALRQLSDAEARALAKGLGALGTALGVALTEAPLLFENGSLQPGSLSSPTPSPSRVKRAASRSV
jgi:DNA-binding MarR family transcriptional regulator